MKKKDPKKKKFWEFLIETSEVLAVESIDVAFKSTQLIGDLRFAKFWQFEPTVKPRYIFVILDLY